MSTASTSLLYVTLLSRALNYVPESGGDTLATALASRMYRHAPPANAVYPYAFFSLKSPQEAAGLQELKVIYTFEGFVVNRPRSAQADTETLADQWAESIRAYVDGSSGLLRFTDVVCESLPPFPAPADASVVQVRVSGRLHVFPLFISALSA